MTPKILGSNIRKARNRMCLSASDLALRIGSERTRIYDIEKGAYRVNVFTAVKIAKALKTTVEKLVQKDA